MAAHLPPSVVSPSRSGRPIRTQPSEHAGGPGGPGGPGGTPDAAFRLERLLAGWPEAFLEIDRSGTVLEWNLAAESGFGWRRDEVVGTFVTETFLPGSFAKTPFGLLAADTTGSAGGPMTGSATDGTLDLALELRHRDGRRIRADARLMVLGMGRDRSVAAFLRAPTEQQLPAPGLLTVGDRGGPTRDDLTGLADRAAYRMRLAGASVTHGGTPGSVAVILLDLDRFKAVNNSMGHALGDRVLCSVARRLEEVAGDVDLLARFGGDEFLALITDGSGHADELAEAFVTRVREALVAPFPVEDAEVFLDASVGVALNTFGADDPDDLMAHAEAAMYQAKRRGGFGSETFDESLRIEVLDRMATEHSLHRALERTELLLHYQPVVDVRGTTTVGVEALIRWNHPDQGLVAPDRFIPVAEESGLIIPIGAWVLEEACHQLQYWHGVGAAEASVAVNLSARQIDDPGIVGTIGEILTRTGLPPGHLTLEITESALMRDAATALVVLRELKELGVVLAIDDFGTGYSSLSYLQRFPLDILKVDRMFVQELELGNGGREIVSAVVSLAHAMGLEVVAEGVETEGQLAELRDLDCDFAQGFLFSRPVPASALTAPFGI